MDIPSAERARNSIFILPVCLLVCRMIERKRERGAIQYTSYRVNKKGLDQRNGSSKGISVLVEWQIRVYHVDGAPDFTARLRCNNPPSLLLVLHLDL